MLNIYLYICVQMASKVSLNETNIVVVAMATERMTSKHENPLIQSPGDVIEFRMLEKGFSRLSDLISASSAKTIAMDRTQSEKMSKEGEYFEDDNKRKRRSGRTRGRVKKRLLNSLDRRDLEMSGEPEVMPEVQTFHSEILQDTSQEKNGLNGHSEENWQITLQLNSVNECLQAERYYWHNEKYCLLREIEESGALYEVQLNEQKCENKTLAATLMNVEQQFESCQVEWQEENASLIQAMRQEANEVVERSQAFHQVQLEEHREETREIAAALKTAEELLETQHLSWQQETATTLNGHSEENWQITSQLNSVNECLQAERYYWHNEKYCLLREIEESGALYEVQLNEQKCENKTLAATLMNVEQQFESCQVEWQEENASLIQAMRQEAKEAVERSQAFHQVQLEEHREETREITAALKKAGDFLETEHLSRPLDNHALLEIEESRALYEVQLNEQICKNKTLAAALMNVEQQFERCQLEWQEEKTSLIHAMRQEAKEAVERSQAFHLAQLEEQREETRKIAAALKTAEELLETQRLSWQQETATMLNGHSEEIWQITSQLNSVNECLQAERYYWHNEKYCLLREIEESRALYEVQLDEQICENKTLAAALMNVEQQFESCQVEWQEENASLIQAMRQEANEVVERSQAFHQVQLEEHREETREIAAALKTAEELLETQHLSWQQETATMLNGHSEEIWQITSQLNSVNECLQAERYYWHNEKYCLLREIEESRALYEVQLDEQKCENKTLAAALMNVEQQFESCQVEWQEENASLIQAMRQEAKEAVERSQAFHQVQLDWQKEKNSLLNEIEESRALYEVQLDEQKCENKTLAAALINVEQKLQSHLVKWQEEKTSLIQTTEGLEKMLQEKAQEWEEVESSMKSQLEDLRSKKKRKWYRRLFCLA
ncbi:centrosome-associated protein CEP250-like isoform X1 [Acanthopagrus latus]|uniref:centrosome-associated protein CEP250-like isoform X1 n=1 Tax=Acanthopagrus latus TaxID=8177 RepID=UPI00187CD21D|nr:centrosome-associated protein CEP250-like isoform X1 [Acanthopagrus latus]